MILDGCPRSLPSLPQELLHLLEVAAPGGVLPGPGPLRARHVYMYICMCVYIYIYMYPEVPTVPLNGTGPISVFRFPLFEFRVPLFTPFILVFVVVVGFIDMLFICTCV